MTLDAVVNFGKVEVLQGYNDTATSITLSAGEGSNLPDPSTDGEFNLVWWNSSDYADPSDDPNVEIIRCTARSTDTLIVIRAQEGISASTKNETGKTYKMILTMTAKMMTDIESDISAKLEAEVNDLTAAVTWTNVPDDNIPESAVTQHESALSIIESQISDLNHYTDSDVESYLNGGNGVSYSIGTIALETLTSDWDIGDGRKIIADEIRARNGDGLKLYDDGGNGIFVEDGGNVGIGTTAPGKDLHIKSSDPTLRIQDSDGVSGYTDLKVGNSGAFTVNVDAGGVSDSEFLNMQISGTSAMYIDNTGNVGIGTTGPNTKLDINGAFTFREKSADPSDPDEGSTVMWMSDGTGTGDDGDVLFKITAGGITKTTTLVDFSEIA